MSQPTIGIILDYIWVPIVTGLILLWRQITGLNTRTALLEQAEAHYKEQRSEDRETQEKRFSLVMKKLDGLDKQIKSGRPLV